MGAGTTLEKVDDFTVRFTFTTARRGQVLYAMAYGTFCPGPSHVMVSLHPANSENTYEEYRNAFPPDYLNLPVMGAWSPVEFRSDDIVFLRRNPFYCRVDESGQQLPYRNEMHYRLSTWADRDVQALAGTGDFSNLEQAENDFESLRRAAEPDAPAKLEFGPRIIGYSLYPNLSGNGWGEPDERGQSIRELSSNADFRMGMTQAIDRVRLGESLVKGPFTEQYPGGLLARQHRDRRRRNYRLARRADSRRRGETAEDAPRDHGGREQPDRHDRRGRGHDGGVRQMLGHLGIDEVEFLRETGATIKYGIRHHDWRNLGHSYDGPIDDRRSTIGGRWRGRASTHTRWRAGGPSARRISSST